MFEILTLPFMQRAFIGGILIGFLASYFGVFVVQRKLSFLGSGLAHAAFGGVALGLLLNTEPLWIAVPFTVVIAIAISWVRERTVLGSDTAIGIFFSVSMALGIVFLFMKREYTSDAFTYLFGSILAISVSDLWITAAIVLVTLLCWPFWKRWAYASFDRELALTDRLRVVRDDYFLSVLIALTIVVAIKVVGIVLIAAFLVIPASSAIIGLFSSYYLDIPSGATIILLQALIFFIVMLSFPKILKS